MTKSTLRENPTVKKFLDDTSKEVSSGTARQYAWHLKWYLDWLNIDPDEVETPEETVDEYLRERAEEDDWSDKTCNVSLYALRRFYRKQLFKDFDASMITITGESTGHRPRLLSRNEVESLFTSAPIHFDETKELMMKTGWECALRRSEVVKLKSEYLLEGNILRCPIVKTRGGISFKRIKIPQDLYDDLSRRGKGVLFVNEKKDRPYSPGEWSSIFGKFTEGTPVGKIRWHDFARHTRLTHYAEDTRSFFDVVQLSGHQNPSVAKKYFEEAGVEVPELEELPEWW